jgi:ribosome maturation factor RimP
MAGRPPAVQRVFDAVAGKIADMGMELVDVEMVREGSSHILRLVIDKTGGVSSEDCASVSRMADPLIDQELQMHGHDFLEVSSPGLDRPLKTERDFQRNQGEWVELSLYKAVDGQKKFIGRMAACTAESICIEPENEPVRVFLREQVAKVRRTIIF